MIVKLYLSNICLVLAALKGKQPGKPGIYSVKVLTRMTFNVLQFTIDNIINMAPAVFAFPGKNKNWSLFSSS